MLRIISGLTIIMLFSLTVVIADAQDTPPGRWWHNSKVVKQLKITGKEAKQLDEAFEDSRIKMVKLKSQVEAEQFKLERLMKKEKAKNSEIKAQYRTLEKARSRLADERFAFVVKARNIVGQDRFQKLVDMAPTGRKGKR